MEWFCLNHLKNGLKFVYDDNEEVMNRFYYWCYDNGYVVLDYKSISVEDAKKRNDVIWFGESFTKQIN